MNKFEHLTDYLKTWFEGKYTLGIKNINFKTNDFAEQFLKEFKTNEFSYDFSIDGNIITFGKRTSITNEFILSIYNINSERSTIDKKHYLGELNLELGNLSIEQLPGAISERLKLFPKNAFIVDDNCAYSGGPEWAVYINETFPETDKEVIERLKTLVRGVRKLDKDRAKAFQTIGLTQS